jgi:hypothetical protein
MDEKGGQQGSPVAFFDEWNAQQGAARRRAVHVRHGLPRRGSLKGLVTSLISV